VAIVVQSIAYDLAPGYCIAIRNLNDQSGTYLYTQWQRPQGSHYVTFEARARLFETLPEFI